MLLWNHREQECVILKHLCGIFQLEIGVYIHWEEKKCLTPCCTVSVAQRDSPNPDCSQCRSNSPNTAAPNQRHVFLINYIPTFIKIMTCYIRNSVLRRLVSAVIRRRQAPDWSRICSQTSWACDDYHIKRGSTARKSDSYFTSEKGPRWLLPRTQILRRNSVDVTNQLNGWANDFLFAKPRGWATQQWHHTG